MAASYATRVGAVLACPWHVEDREKEMARRRENRAPPTPAQRRRMILIGALLVFAACFVVMFEVVVNERLSLLFVIIAALVLFLVFILPIITSLRHAQRMRHRTMTRQAPSLQEHRPPQ